MKLKELLKNVKDVELTKEQEKQIKDYLGIKDNKKWVPEKNESYFYIDDDGKIDKITYAQPGCSNYEFRILTNNYFKTEEKAEFRLEQIKVYNELKNFADDNNDEIDWENENEDKFYINYVHLNKQVSCFTANSIQDIGQIYFTSEKVAIQAIEKVGEDRIKKYLFGVWE